VDQRFVILPRSRPEFLAGHFVQPAMPTQSLRQFSRQSVASAETRLREILPFILPNWQYPAIRTGNRTWCPDLPTI
jgi:hypothetical protein